MLTQKLIAHLPLLLHKDPKDVFIIGLGSGMTAGAALTHSIQRADVIEISPDVVEASNFFKKENRNALADRRLHLIVGDGRSHLALTDRKYDAIISEPSNPWIAGVSSLFTREFFANARERLAPGGVICQWINAYNISGDDLKSVVATFTGVFPDGTVWLVGGDDVLMLATLDPLADALARVPAAMQRPDVAADLAGLAVRDPFSIRSLFVGGGDKLREYSGSARPFTDDRLTLEFTAPRELHNQQAGRNGDALRKFSETLTATAAEWRNRALMQAQADHHQLAYEDFLRAVDVDPNDEAALDGLVTTAAILGKSSDAIGRLNGHGSPSAHRLVALSKLFAADGKRDDALGKAQDAAGIDSRVGTTQLASLYADAGDTVQLDRAVGELRKIAPDDAATGFYAAVASFLHGDAVNAIAFANKAIDLDPKYAPTYDLIGAAYTKIGAASEAKRAFEKSLELNAHDSTAYENIGIIELNAGNRSVAAKYFAEALWLVPDSQTARQGLAEARR
jgi:tetratricopeptide (TPR) repeat protein